ncbi:MAG: ribonuclease R [Planctomycetaceae bacterium]|nr:ribonuclease R [Planctomycetaceae bacterium]
MASIAQQILDYTSRDGYRPEKPKALAKKLGVTKKHQNEFDSALHGLISDGRLRFLDSGRVAVSVPPGYVLGLLQKTASGAGFLIPHEPRPPRLVGDVYIDRRDMRDAQQGDEVLVRLISRRRSGGQRCGIIVDVVERATNVFVGSYYVEGEAGWVQIDGKNFNEPIWVGDPGAKGAQDGDKVVIEMLRFPSHGQKGEAVLTEVLGPRGKTGVDTLTIIHEYGIPDEFPDEVLEDARLEAENFDPDNVDGREDLRNETIVTIDPKDARDFDDAISLKQTKDGHWHLGVHIADVSHFVQPGTALGREAEKRGTSVYLPTKVIPMLPEVISNGLASLQEKHVRYAKSAFIEFTTEGVPVHTRFASTAISVTKRFAYEQVMPLIKAGKGAKGKVSAPVHKLLCDMYTLAMTLRKRRFESGALEMHLPEIKLDFDKQGKVSGAHERDHDESHQIIEEFMLAANVAVATELARRKLPFLRRAHGEPNEAKLKAFGQFVGSLGYELKNVQSRTAIQRLLNDVKDAPESQAVNYALLRSMKQAEYTPFDVGHYALAEDDYCHFTSPIRRYPDLLVHRLIDGILTKRKTHKGTREEELVRLGRHCSTTERRAERAERELTKIKLLSYLEERIGQEMDAVITGVDRFGFFCRGTDLPAEGLVHISTFPQKDNFDFDRDVMTLTGRRTGQVFRLGDRVRVTVAHVDVDRRELDFQLVKHLGQIKPKRKSIGSRKKQTGKRTPTKKSTAKQTSKQPQRSTQKKGTSRKKNKRRRRS